MHDPGMVLLWSAVAATVVTVIWRFARKRRDLLGSFERAFDNPQLVTIKEYRYGDESETSTCWAISGRAGTYDFTLEAKDRRSGSGVIWYTLAFSDGAPTRFGDYGYGGDNKDSRKDQKRLAKLFARIWPEGRYPAPDPRPERLREFLSRP